MHEADRFEGFKINDFQGIKRIPHSNKLRKKQDLLWLRMLYLFLQ
jgi:hypothetical protein